MIIHLPNQLSLHVSVLSMMCIGRALARVNNRRESIQLQYTCTRQGNSRESNVTSTRADDVYPFQLFIA